MVHCSCGKVIEKIPNWMQSVKVEYVCNNCPNRQVKPIAQLAAQQAAAAAEAAQAAQAASRAIEDEAEIEDLDEELDV
jgi:hypothetical protein